MANTGLGSKIRSLSLDILFKISTNFVKETVRFQS